MSEAKKKPRGRPRKPINNKELSVAEGWTGDLSRKLRPIQSEIYKHIKATDSLRTVVNAHRGLGKSYLCTILALEEVYKGPGRHVKLISPTQKMTRAIIHPIMKELLSDCPEDQQPSFRYMDGLYEFPNGSTLLTAGSDLGQADSLRGTSTHLVIYDEAGFMDSLEYLHTSVISPRLVQTKGKAIFVSTPPTSPQHFFARLVSQASKDGDLFTFTVDDNPFLEKEMYDAFVKECGGSSTVSFRREFLCEVITDDKFAVFPEIARGELVLRKGLPSSLEDKGIINQRVIGIHLDLAGTTAAVFLDVYSDGTVTVARDMCFNDLSGYHISKKIYSAATDLWNGRPFIAVADTNKDILNSFNRQGGLFVMGLDIDLLQTGVSDARRYLASDQVTFLEGNVICTDITDSILDQNRRNIAVVDGYKFPYLRAFLTAVHFATRFHSGGRGKSHKSVSWDRAMRGVFGLKQGKGRLNI